MTLEDERLALPEDALAAQFGGWPESRDELALGRRRRRRGIGARPRRSPGARTPPHPSGSRTKGDKKAGCREESTVGSSPEEQRTNQQPYDQFDRHEGADEAAHVCEDLQDSLLASHYGHPP